MTAVHQFVPTLAPRDAIGAHVLQMRALLRDVGFTSDIYVVEAHKDLRRQARHYREWNGSHADTYLMYQCSTGSPMGEWLAQRPEPLLIDYHNITPAELIEPWEPVVGAELIAARLQLGRLARRAELGMGVSAYNRQELDEVGCPTTAVAPILFDEAAFEGQADSKVAAQLAAEKERGGAEWLFVGRLSPNKCQHDIVKAFALYRFLHDDRARLHLVGGSSSHAYLSAVRKYVAALGLDDAVRMTGTVPHAALVAYFRSADVFVCLSEHEGFCVPLLEAMHHRLPIVAYAAAAVPETLAGAGLLLEDKSPACVAEAVHRVRTDADLRAALVATGSRRVGDFTLQLARDRTTAVLEKVIL